MITGCIVRQALPSVGSGWQVVENLPPGGSEARVAHASSTSPSPAEPRNRTWSRRMCSSSRKSGSQEWACRRARRAIGTPVAVRKAEAPGARSCSGSRHRRFAPRRRFRPAWRIVRRETPSWRGNHGYGQEKERPNDKDRRHDAGDSVQGQGEGSPRCRSQDPLTDGNDQSDCAAGTPGRAFFLRARPPARVPTRQPSCHFGGGDAVKQATWELVRTPA